MCLTLSVIRERHIKSPVRHHTNIAIIKSACVDEKLGQVEFPQTDGGNVKCVPSLKDNFVFL